MTHRRHERQDPQQRRTSSDDRRLQRALERWQPQLHRLVEGDGPGRASRTTTSTSAPRSRSTSEGWAHFDYVKMPDYRWGIFLADAERRTAPSASATTSARPVWHEVPGEYRVRPAPPDRRRRATPSRRRVEQQRRLGLTAPSLYDLRNLFQVNVEEGRHLWAMVYLLHAYFGRDGREEADATAGAPLGRRRQAAHPRRLQRADHRTGSSFFMFTYFTDRDGKFQLRALAESGFDPLARTLPLHAHRGGAPHVRRRRRSGPRWCSAPGELMRRARHRGRGAVRRDQPRHHPALPQLPLQRLARPLRRRDLDQRRQLLRGRAQGSLPGGGSSRRPPAPRCVLHHRRHRRGPDREPASSPPCPPSMQPCATTTSRTARRGSTAGTGPSPRSGPASGCPFPTSASTGGSGRTPAASHTDRRVSRLRRRVGRAAPGMACPTVAGRDHAASVLIPGDRREAGWPVWVAPPATNARVHDQAVEFGLGVRIWRCRHAGSTASSAAAWPDRPVMRPRAGASKSACSTAGDETALALRQA